MPGTARVTINEKEWAVDVALSPSELAAGLGGIASIPAGTGMLFELGTEQAVEVTTEPMLFNIDIIFISEGLEVVDMVRDVAPGFLVTEDTPVRYFLEVSAGETEGIEAGDSVEIADYEYTPSSAISQWMPMIIGLSVLGFVGAMVGGVMRGGSSSSSSSSQRRLGKPKTGSERRETHEKKYGTADLPERGKGLKSHRSNPGDRPTRDDVEVHAWQERDRLGIWVEGKRAEKTIAEWWDDDARKMFDDGFFKPGVPQYSWEKPSHAFVNSILDYLEDVGILTKKRSSSPDSMVKKRCHGAYLANWQYGGYSYIEEDSDKPERLWIRGMADYVNPNEVIAIAEKEGLQSISLAGGFWEKVGYRGWGEKVTINEAKVALAKAGKHVLG